MTVDSPRTDAALLRRYRIRVAVFLVGTLVFLVFLNTVYKGINTIYVLNAVESERDQWQRPVAVVSSLSLKKGDVVADVGSGAGYFSLKLSRAVGRSGTVFAVDIRRLPLVFVRVRAFSGGLNNIHVLVGDQDDPHLPVNTVDAVLVANTYHEFAAPQLMLNHIFRSLRFGGRLVVLDRSPAGDDSGHHPEQNHEIPLALVEAQLRLNGFRIVNREDRFIERPGEVWWLLVAQRQ